jgi:ABC-type sugar transport system permease subunit
MLQKARKKLIVPFVLPALLLYTLMYTYPVVQTILWSFTGWSGHTVKRPFVGLQNYATLLIDRRFVGAVKNTLIFASVGGILLFAVGLLLAWGLSQPIRFRRVFRFIVLAPMVISVAVAGLIWRMIYEPNLGLLNNILRAVGLDNLALPWMGDTRTALAAIIIASVWWQLGMWVLLLLAGLERVPADLQDAAKVDGASELQVFWQVTLPLLWDVLRTLLVVWVILSLQVFAIVLVMSPWGGVSGATQVTATYIYYTAFNDFKWGYATAVATVVLLLIFGLSMITMRTMRREAIEF